MERLMQIIKDNRHVAIKKDRSVRDLYNLSEIVGRGKFGVVYRCREKSTGLTFAAKFVKTTKKEDRKDVEREMEIMRMLQHPRLLQLYDAFDDGKHEMCLILELIEGGELFERVIDDDFVLTERACAIFMRQICEGVQFMHSKNVLHLDMKPENVLCLTRTGNRIKLIDFGLARRFDPARPLQVLFGTPEFVAPEVVNFEPVGYGTDMWSLGVICYVLLSGLSPFMGDTDMETMSNVVIAEYDFNDAAFDEISEDAKDFIRKLLIKKKEDRMRVEESLKHPWIQGISRGKNPSRRRDSLDQAKENLRDFVVRWSESPRHSVNLSSIKEELRGIHVSLSATGDAFLHGARKGSAESSCSVDSDASRLCTASPSTKKRRIQRREQEGVLSFVEPHRTTSTYRSEESLLRFSKRLMPGEALEHAWIKGTSKAEGEKPLPDLNKAQLKRYVVRRRWRKGRNCLIALKRMGATWEKLRKGSL
ncbi:unnamed protein product [Darwinula stevensoni]|uniref:Protein kinase domain-containing protein n=1 Tax=Darwinula stevensoni TaxID=69355 RepID=A0A7R9AD97_9CRUS|nr:unnamed protein product [Darwinula stevensoni]CAG0901107.1 unnamed protein product [Darwinula stevensoni]